MQSTPEWSPPQPPPSPPPIPPTLTTLGALLCQSFWVIIVGANWFLKVFSPPLKILWSVWCHVRAIFTLHGMLLLVVLVVVLLVLGRGISVGSRLHQTDTVMRPVMILPPFSLDLCSLQTDEAVVMWGNFSASLPPSCPSVFVPRQ